MNSNPVLPDFKTHVVCIDFVSPHERGEKKQKRTNYSEKVRSYNSCQYS